MSNETDETGETCETGEADDTNGTVVVPFVSASAYVDPAVAEIEAEAKATGLPPNQTQLGVTLRNGCGWATEAMKALWMGKSLDGSIAYWKAQVDVLQDGSTYLDLQKMDRWYGLTPVVRRDQPYPYTTLIWYRDIPPGNQAPGYVGHDFGHWVLRIGDTNYNDPLFRDQSGAGLYLPKEKLDDIERAPSYRVGIVERPVDVVVPPPTGSAGMYIATEDARVRTGPDLSNPNNILGVLLKGTKWPGKLVTGSSFIEVEVTIVGASVDGIALVPSSANDDKITGYVSTNVARPA